MTKKVARSELRSINVWLDGVWRATMSNDGRDRASRFEAKHAEIIEKILAWADAAAARDDYPEALRWVDAVGSLGDELPSAYQAKRETWRRAVRRR